MTLPFFARILRSMHANASTSYNNVREKITSEIAGLCHAANSLRCLVLMAGNWEALRRGRPTARGRPTVPGLRTARGEVFQSLRSPENFTLFLMVIRNTDE